MNPVNSATYKANIDDRTGAVTILTCRTGAHFGGYAHRAYDYPDAKGFGQPQVECQSVDAALG